MSRLKVLSLRFIHFKRNCWLPNEETRHVHSAALTVSCKASQPPVPRWIPVAARYTHHLSRKSSLNCKRSTSLSPSLSARKRRFAFSNLTTRDLTPRHSAACLFSSTTTNCNMSMDLEKLVSLLYEFAPTTLAGSWDNVGLLVEPTSPHKVKTVFLTNDLTEEVLTEAVNKKADFILAYHPPIFVPFKRLTMNEVKERIIVRAIENRIAIYSPHTCYDAVEGGVNDWLVEGLGDVVLSKPLEPCYQDLTPSGDDFNISFMGSESEVCTDVQKLSGVQNVSSITLCKGSNIQVTCTCRKSNLGDAVSAIQQMASVDTQSVQITQLCKAPMLKTGMGRFAALSQPAPTSEMVERIKLHLKLDHVQIAFGRGKTLDSMVFTVAVCAGSGSSVLKNVKTDLYLTGEMSHHDILAAVAMGTTVVVCNHSNTERGFLRVLQKKLTKMLENRADRLNVIVSEVDKDPLQVI